MKKPRVGIIDYGMGNIFSVQNAIATTGASTTLIDKPELLANIDAVVLPGVGAFDVAIDRLKERELWFSIIEEIGSGVPVLGICLGLQLLTMHSDEHGQHDGMGFVKRATKRFLPNAPESIKVPHVGWNEISINKRSFPGQAPGLFDKHYYFVHSYLVEGIGNSKDAEVLGLTSYRGVTFLSFLQDKNITGIQAHPEKSGPIGLKFFEWWLQSL